MPAGEVKRAQKEARQRSFLDHVRLGKQIQEALELAGVPENTYRNKWRRDPDFRAQVEHAKKSGDRASAEGYPDFLYFREKHFAYEDPRVRHPVTGLPTVRRARNSWFQIDATEKLEERNRTIIVMPPGHVKTTFFSIERQTHNIMGNRNFRATIVQKNQDEAAKIVSAVQERLDHPYYHNLADRLTAQGDVPIECPVCAYGGDYGFKPMERGGRAAGDKWGAYGFKVTGRTSGEKDDTYQAKGVGSQIQGVRADEIILDDVQDPMTATKSQHDSEEKLDWFQKVIMGRVYDWQKVIVLANFFSPDDFAHKLIDFYQDWPVTNYAAIVDYDTKQVLCPEVWTFDALMKKRREVGESVWHFTWEQQEGSFEHNVFQREALEAARNDDFVIGTVPYPVTHVFVGVDPAISQFCAMVVWGLDIRTGQRYLIDVFNQKGMRTFGNITDKILDLTRAYAPRVCAIEMNNVQGSITNDPTFSKAMRALGCRVTTYQTRTETGARSEHDAFDISTIGGLFDAGLITLPYGGTGADRERIDAYIEQLLQWRPGVKYLTRDMVMATLFAESECYPVLQRGQKKRPKRHRDLPEWVMNAEGRFADRAVV